MLSCGYCGVSNRQGTHYCRQCGKPLDQIKSANGIVQCPKCGAALRSNVRFCRLCGAALDAASASQRRCAYCRQPMSLQARFCKFCGHPVVPAQDARCPQCQHLLRPGARFCPVCGVSTSIAPAALPQKPATPSSNVGRSASGRLLGASTLIERYIIVERIAKGGMGAIYKAMDKRLSDKIVAIKEMSETVIPLEEREAVLESFRREAQLLATLQHPNLIRVTDTFQVQDAHYMVMEYVPGKTLQALLDETQEQFAEDQVLHWVQQLCSVLLYLHSQSPPIIYRDMKPSNIMVVEDTDQVKLIDFGIARFYKPGKRKDTIQFGTDGYAPPEQYGKAQTDVRSDIYALGAVLHQLLTLRDPQTVLFQFPPIRDLNSQISQRVSDAIACAVESNKENRPSDVGEFWTMLTGRDTSELRMAAENLPVSTAQAATPSASGSLLDMGRITLGANLPHGSLRIPVAQDETAEVVSETPWLRLEWSTVDFDRQDVGVALFTASLKSPCLRLQGNKFKEWLDLHTRFLVPVPHTLLARVRVERDNGLVDHIPIIVHAHPPEWQVLGGWALVIGLMLTETAIALGVVATLLAALSNL